MAVDVFYPTPKGRIHFAISGPYVTFFMTLKQHTSHCDQSKSNQVTKVHSASIFAESLREKQAALEFTFIVMASETSLIRASNQSYHACYQGF